VIKPTKHVVMYDKTRIKSYQHIISQTIRAC